MIRRVRGGSIKDLKLRREGEQERGLVVYPYRRVIGVVSGYTPYG